MCIEPHQLVKIIEKDIIYSPSCLLSSPSRTTPCSIWVSCSRSGTSCSWISCPSGATSSSAAGASREGGAGGSCETSAAGFCKADVDDAEAEGDEDDWEEPDDEEDDEEEVEEDEEYAEEEDDTYSGSANEACPKKRKSNYTRNDLSVVDGGSHMPQLCWISSRVVHIQKLCKSHTGRCHPLDIEVWNRCAKLLHHLCHHPKRPVASHQSDTTHQNPGHPIGPREPWNFAKTEPKSNDNKESYHDWIGVIGLVVKLLKRDQSIHRWGKSYHHLLIHRTTIFFLQIVLQLLNSLSEAHLHRIILTFYNARESRKQIQLPSTSNWMHVLPVRIHASCIEPDPPQRDNTAAPTTIIT